MHTRRNARLALYGFASLIAIVGLGCRSDAIQAPSDAGVSDPARDSDSTDPTTAQDASGAGSAHRLNVRELAGTFRALLGKVPSGLRHLPDEDGNFNVEEPAVSGFEVDVYWQAALEAADGGSKTLLDQWGCKQDMRCVREAAGRWLETAFRGPLDPAEREAYLSLLPDRAKVEPAVTQLLQLTFQAPRFLYRVEQGVEPTEAGEAPQLTSWELAARLSYALWSEPPDEALRADAESGRLFDGDVLAQQARRLLADPRAARVLGSAFQNWAAPELEVVAKAEPVYPEFNAPLRESMIEQLARFSEMALADGLSLSGLLTTTRAPLDERLAALLGMSDSDAAGDDAFADWKIVELTQPSFGLLTLPGVLTSNSRADDSSPIQRGLFVRQNLLCQPVPPPPPGVAALPPAKEPGMSFRDRFEEHTRNPACAGCHELIDPLGVPFEVYDGLGRWRSDPNIVTAGRLDGVEKPFDFSNLHEFVDGLLTAPEVPRCWAEQWMLRLLGPNATQDHALRDRLTAQVAGDVSLADLLVAIVTTPAFQRVR